MPPFSSIIKCLMEVAQPGWIMSNAQEMNAGFICKLLSCSGVLQQMLSSSSYTAEVCILKKQLVSKDVMLTIVSQRF